MAFVPRWYTREQEERDQQRYPELQFSDPDELLRIDRANVRDGFPLTSFGQTAIDSSLRAGVPPEEREAIERETQTQIRGIHGTDYLNLFGRAPAPEPTPAPIAIQQFRDSFGLDGGMLPDFRPQSSTRGAETIPGPEAIREFGDELFNDPNRRVERDNAVIAQMAVGAGQLLDEITALPVRTAIRRPGDALTDFEGAITEQRESEEGTFLGVGLQGSGIDRALDFVPFSDRDLPVGVQLPDFLGGRFFGVDDVSVRDFVLGSTDVLADAGAIFAAAGLTSDVARLSPRITASVRANGFRSVLPSISTDTVRPAIAGASQPTLVQPDMAGTIARGAAARNAAEAALRRGDSVGSEVLRTLDGAAVIVAQDKPGVIGDIINDIPGLSQLRAFDQPRFGLPDDILEAYVGQGAALAEFHTRALPSRVQSLQAVDNLFGSGASRGEVISGVRYLGPDDGYPAIGTAFDMFQRPDLYDLTDAQRRLIQNIDDRNLAFRSLANNGYGTDIGRFAGSRPGSAYLPNIDASESQEALRALSEAPATRSVASGSTKPRVFDTGYERWLNDLEKAARGEIDPDEVFVPDVDLARLLTSMDAQKANAAAGEVYRAGLPGLTRAEAIEQVAPRLVESRNSLRSQIDSLRGKIRRAEQAIRRDESVSRALERQIADNDNRVSQLVKRAEQAEDGLPELDALRGIIDELELRQQALNEAVSGPASRVSRQGVRVSELRAELADVLEQYTEIRRAYEATNLRGQQFVGDGLYRYFPAEQANQLRTLSRQASGDIFRAMAELNASVLSGDGSVLLGVQGQLAALVRPFQTMQKVTSGIAGQITSRDPWQPFRLGTLADDIARDPDGWANFSFWLGRPAGSTALPEELSGGLFARMAEKLGVPISEANEGMYRVITRRMKDDFEFFARKLIDDGARPDEAYAAAIDAVTKAIPVLNPRRLGQSAAQATAQRAPFTSISFLRQPAALMQQAAAGYIKTGLFRPLTPREEIARDIVTRMAATSIGTISAMAYIDAQLKGIDPQAHVEDSVRRLRMPIPGTDRTLSIGGPFRGIVNAIRPQEVDGSPVPLPFAGIGRFFNNRLSPVIGTQLDLVRNEDFKGDPILTEGFPQNIIQGLMYERNAIFPISGQAVTEGVIEGDSLRTIAADTLFEAAGTSAGRNPDFVRERQTRDALARQASFTDPVTGDEFTVDSFEELEARVGSQVAIDLINERDTGLLSELAEHDAEEARETATGVDDAEQAFAQLDVIGQERLDWAMDIQRRIDTGELTLADARRIERERNWSGEIAGVIRAFAPVFERGEAPTLDEAAKLTDVNDVRDAYFATLELHIDPLSGNPSDEWYDVFEPQFIAAVGEEMWSRVQANIGVRNRAPWQLEIRDIRTSLAREEFFDIRSEVWSRVADRLDVGEFADPSLLRTEIRQRILARGTDPTDAMILTQQVYDEHPAIKVWRDVSNTVEQLWIEANPQLAADAVRAGYLQPGSLRQDEEAAILGR